MKFSLPLLFILPFFTCIAQETGMRVKSKLTKAVMYMNSAELTHAVKANVTKGKTDIIITGIAPQLDQKSIRASATGDVKIISITYENDYMEVKKDNQIITALEDSLEKYTKQVNAITYEQSAYAEEKQLLTDNTKLGGANTGVSVAELQKAADFYRNRIKDINSQLFRIDWQKQKLEGHILKTGKQLAELNVKKSIPGCHIVITVSSSITAATEIEIKYMVYEAGWAPYYDIRAKDVNSPISLDYKAKIFNNSGIDWNDIRLALSTADPTLSAQKPKLDPWTLNYNSDRDNEGYLNKQGVVNSGPGAGSGKNTYNLQGNTSEVEVSELNVEFEIKEPYTLPSINKVYIVEIQTIEIPATYYYYAIPKIDRDAFLIASITGWESLNLIEGPANIFYAGSYVGESYIDTRFANDSLSISLGRDKKVAITRTKKQDFSDKKIFGTQHKENFIYEITVRNNNKLPIDIEIIDQVPVSQEGDIKVDIQEISQAAVEEQSGTLKWKMNLAPSDTKHLTISFSVQYPKNKNVKVRKFRRVQKSAAFL